MGNVQGGDRSSFHGKRNHSTSGGPYAQSPPGNAFWPPDDDASYGNTMNANYLTTDSGGLQIRLSCDDYSSGQRTANIVKFDEMQEFPVVLKYTGNAKAVFVTGSWDGWRKKIPMVRSTNDFTTIINLPEGRHEFKFTVDGRTICDHNFPKSGDNNLLMVDKADFEVFDALDRDSQAVAASRNVDSSGGGGQRQSLTAPSPGGGNGSDTSDTESSNEAGGADSSQYGQIIPPRRAFDKSHAPPALPPHLLQVILNKDTPISCDPNVLPEPNHVMLNHLYALSIKDDVMVLSATHRYRKKYVTTLLYKPI